MKALIFGAGGQVGRALVRAAPRGAEIAALDRAGCDIGDRAASIAFSTAAGAQYVFNAAAYTAVDRAEEEPEEARRLNAVAPGVIAAAARASGARMIHLSTDFVFGGGGGSPRTPAEPPEPRGVYACTKRDGELAVLEADPDALVVRTAWVHAAGGRNFVATMLRLMEVDGAVRVIDDQIGTPTWAPSLAGALWPLALGGACGIHHYTDAGVASWYDFAIAIAEEARAAGLLQRDILVTPVATADFPTPAPRPSYSVLDKTATWAFLGRAAPHWRVTLRAHIEDLQGQ